VNATLLMLSSVFMTGHDHAGPAVVSTGSSCNSCATAAPACDDGCGHKPGLFSRLKGKFSKGCGCDAAPACAAPAPACNTCAEPACKSSCFGGFNLFGRFKHKSKSCETCDTGCATNSCATGDCASGTTIGVPSTTSPIPSTSPEMIPAPKKEMPKDLPKGGVTNLRIEPIVTPVVAPRQTIDVTGPSNPF